MNGAAKGLLFWWDEGEVQANQVNLRLKARAEGLANQARSYTEAFRILAGMW